MNTDPTPQIILLLKEFGKKLEKINQKSLLLFKEVRRKIDAKKIERIRKELHQTK